MPVTKNQPKLATPGPAPPGGPLSRQTTAVLAIVYFAAAGRRRAGAEPLAFWGRGPYRQLGL